MEAFLTKIKDDLCKQLYDESSVVEGYFNHLEKRGCWNCGKQTIHCIVGVVNGNKVQLCQKCYIDWKRVIKKGKHKTGRPLGSKKRR